MPDGSEDEARRLLAEIDEPPQAPSDALDAAPVSDPEPEIPAPFPRTTWGARVAGRRRALAGAVMAVAGAAWLGVGAATLATLPCALGGVFLVLGLWVVLGAAETRNPASD